MERIYLDHAASTPVDPEVLRTMTPYFGEKFGNPGSLHSFGQEAIAAVDRSREAIAKALGAEFRDVIFTGSATEANNLALRGAVKRFRAAGRPAPRVIVSSIEHESVLETARDLAREGAEVIFIPADPRGMVDEKKIKESLTPDTAIVSVIYAQNEIGTIQPVAGIAKLVREFRSSLLPPSSILHPQSSLPHPLFHTDAAQAFQFLPCGTAEQGIDLMTISSHKIYGPKVIGALCVRAPRSKSSILDPLITGGGQEFGLRSGTENVPLIVGFANAVELAAGARAGEAARVAKLRDLLWEGIRKIVPGAERNPAVLHPRSSIPNSPPSILPNILNVYFPGHDAQGLLTNFDLRGLAVSSGSACRSRAAEASYVIEALGYGRERARSSIRFSLGRTTKEADVDGALAVVAAVFATFSEKSRITK